MQRGRRRMSADFLLPGLGALSLSALVLFLLARSLVPLLRVALWRPSPLRDLSPCAGERGPRAAGDEAADGPGYRVAAPEEPCVADTASSPLLARTTGGVRLLAAAALPALGLLAVAIGLAALGALALEEGLLWTRLAR
jgi:hypothetical protein